MTIVIWAIVLFPLNCAYFDAHNFPSAYMRYSSCKDVDVLSIWANELSPLNHTYFDAHNFPSAYISCSSCKIVDVLSTMAITMEFIDICERKVH